MKNINKNISKIIPLFAVGLFILQAPLASAAATFNTSSQDFPTVRAVNHTLYPDSSSHWSTSVSAQPGDVIGISIYYHNTGSENAKNTKVKITLPSSSASSNFSISGSVFADNAGSAWGSASISISSSQTLTYIPGSVKWYPNQSTWNYSSLLYGQNGSEILGSGLNIGDIAPGWETQGSVVAYFQVSSASIVEPKAPTVTTNSATNITKSSATLNGYVNPNGSTDTVRWFEWGTCSSNNINNTQSVYMSSSASNVNANISGLSANTTYCFTAVAQNSAGKIKGNVLWFTTLPDQQIPQAQAPSVTTNSATNVTQSSATLNGYVNPNNTSDTVRWFEWGTSSNNLTNSSQSVYMSSSASNVNAYASGLSANTTYYFRVVAQNSAGRTDGSVLSFTTQTGQNQNGQAPSVSTYSATNVTQSSATLNGYVNPNGTGDTMRWFEYYYSGSGTLSTNHTFQGYNSSNFNEYIYGLNANTTYYFRAVAQNSAGIYYGSYYTFNTGGNVVPPVTPTAPVAITNSAVGVTQASAVLNGTALPGTGIFTNAWFEWGTSMSMPNQTTQQSIGTGSSIAFSQLVSGLNPGTIYYYRAVIQTPYGTSRGIIFSFQTTSYYNPPIIPPVTPPGYSNLSVKKEVDNVSFPNGTKNSVAAAAGNTVRYTITVTNTGTNNLDSVEIGDVLSGFVDYMSSSDGGYYDSSSRKVTWDISNLGKGEKRIVTVDVTARQLPDNVVAENVATADVSGLKTRTSNEIIVLINTSPLILSISSDKDTLYSRNEFTYTVNYRNEGESELKNLRLQIILPGIIKYEGSRDGFRAQDNILVLDLPNLIPNEEGSRSFQVKVNSDLQEEETVVTTAVMSYFDTFLVAQKSVEAYIMHDVGPSSSIFSAFLLQILPSSSLDWFLLFLCLVVISIIIFLLKRKNNNQVGNFA